MREDGEMAPQVGDLSNQREQVTDLYRRIRLVDSLYTSLVNEYSEIVVTLKDSGRGQIRRPFPVVAQVDTLEL